MNKSLLTREIYLNSIIEIFKGNSLTDIEFAEKLSKGLDLEDRLKLIELMDLNGFERMEYFQNGFYNKSNPDPRVPFIKIIRNQPFDYDQLTSICLYKL